MSPLFFLLFSFFDNNIEVSFYQENKMEHVEAKLKELEAKLLEAKKEIE